MLRVIARNTILLSVSQVAARGIGFVYVILVARFLGVHDFGVYSFTLAFIYNFIPIADFGIERLVLRDISRDGGKASYYLSRLLPLRLGLALLAYLLAIGFGVLLGQNLRQIIYLAIFGLALIPYSLVFLFSSIFNAKEKMEYMALANIVQVVLTAVIGGIFIFLELGLIWVLFAYPLANSLVCTLFFCLAGKWGLPLGWKIDWRFWKESLRESWVFAALIILAVFYLRLSTVMVNLIEGAVSTGLYSSGYKFAEALILVPQSIALALFPLSSRLIAQDKEKLRRVYKKSLVVLFASSLPFALVLALGSRLIINIAYGSDYLPAVPVFGILGVGVVLFFINSLAGNIIQNSKLVKGFLPFAALNFIVLFSLSLLLIPRYSIVGAAWAVVGGEVFGLVINNFYVYKILKTDKNLAGSHD